MTDYFARLMVFDSGGNDCFKKGHPNREELTELFIDKMRKIGRNSSMYELFR